MHPVDADDESHETFGTERVREMLSAHVWRDMQRVDGAANDLRFKNGMDDQDVVDETAGADDPVDEEELSKFENALKAMALHPRSTATSNITRSTNNSSAQAADSDDIGAVNVSVNESAEQRQARLDNAERMMAMFLQGVGMKFDDI